MRFVPLQVISAYSLLQSTLSVPDLVKSAKVRGYRSLALTDYNVMYGAVEFYSLCRNNHIHPIIGLILSLKGFLSDETYQLILLARNQKGYLNLIKISTLRMTDAFHGDLDWRKITPYLSGLYIIHPLHQELGGILRNKNLAAAKKIIRIMTKQVAPQWIKIGVASSDTANELKIIQRFTNHYRLAVVALSPVAYLNSDDAFYLRVLRAIRDDVKIPSPVKTYRQSRFGRHWLKPNSDVVKTLRTTGLTRALTETNHIAKSCHVVIKKRQMRLPHFFDQHEKVSGHGQSSRSYLRYLSMTGLKKRLGVNQFSLIPWRYRHRLHRELKVISEMGFDDYFLIVWDIMHFIRNHHITTGDGRGSAAGSLVAYVLYITNVDPIRYHLLFERFLNKERAQMPDIDLDIPDIDRDRVLTYVHHKYRPTGVANPKSPLQERVSQIITFDTMAAKQALRDAGRVFGLSNRQLNQWSRSVPKVPKITLKQAYFRSAAIRRLCLAGRDLNPNVKLNQLLFKTAIHIEGLPRHFSTHAAGLIVSDLPVVRFSPLQRGNGRLLMTQYSKNYAEGVGLLKIDFLGLRNLTLLGNVLKTVKRTFNPHFNLERINLNDPSTLRLFQAGDTDGIFQFESTGIKRVLRKLKPDSFALVAMVNALYRPGPINNIDSFIRRRRGQERITYPDRSLRRILAPTFGIIIYQEQVMLVAQIMGGFTLGQADILRRAMSKKKHRTMAAMQTKFLNGAHQKGFPVTVAKRTFDYMNRFASYGFNKSHAVAYSKLAFQLAYLKTHYSTAFFAALLNTAAGNYYLVRRYLTDAREMNVKILPPDVNLSQRGCTVYHQQLLLGLAFLRGISNELVSTIIQRRTFPLKDLNQFILMVFPVLLLEARSNLQQRSVQHDGDPTPILFPLIYSGALDSISCISAGGKEIPRNQLRSACYRIFQAINGNYNRFSGSQIYKKEYLESQKYRPYAHDQNAPESTPQYNGYLRYRQALHRFKTKARLGLRQHRQRIAKGVKIFEFGGLKLTTDRDSSNLALRRKAYYYLNFNRLDFFSPLRSLIQLTPLRELQKSHGVVQIMVVVSSVRVIRTKNGEPMAFVTGTDSVNQITVVVFTRVYNQINRFLRIKRVLVVQGTLERRRQELQVVARYVWPATNLMSRYRSQKRVYDWRRHCCYLRVPHLADTASNWHRLTQTVHRYPGRYPIFIFEPVTHAKYVLSSSFAVANTASVRMALTGIFGEGNVTFK